MFKRVSGWWKRTENFREKATSAEAKFVTMAVLEAAAMEYIRYRIDPSVRALGHKIDNVFEAVYKVGDAIKEGVVKVKEGHEEVTDYLAQKMYEFTGHHETRINLTKKESIERTEVQLVSLVGDKWEWFPHRPRFSDSFETTFSNYLNWVTIGIITYLLYRNTRTYFSRVMERKRVKRLFKIYSREFSAVFDDKIKDYQSRLAKLEAQLSKLLEEVEKLRARTEAYQSTLPKKILAVNLLQMKLFQSGKLTPEIQKRLEGLLVAFQDNLNMLYQEIKKVEVGAGLASDTITKILVESQALASAGVKKIPI